MKNELRWKVAQAAEIRWWQNYLRKKPKKDYLKWKHAYWVDLIEQTGLPVNEGAQVLDAGCGPAGVFMALEKCQVDAVDPLLDTYEEKLDHFKKQDYPHVQFYHAPLETFSPDQSYDQIYCLNAINHVADLALCFDKLVSMTKPGGDLVVSIDAHNFSFFKHLFRLLPGDILHPHQFDLEEYEAMLTARNCTIKKSLLFKKEFFFNYFVLVVKRNS